MYRAEKPCTESGRALATLLVICVFVHEGAQVVLGNVGL